MTKQIIIPENKIAIIGNGPGLLNTKLGFKIDKHDEVVRFNEFRCVGFENDYGSKTTIYSTFGRGMLPADPSRPAKVIMIHENGKPAYLPEFIWNIPFLFYIKVRSKIREISNHKNKANLNPSSGTLVTLWLIEEWGALHISLGIDHFNKDKSKQHHYWNLKAFGKPADHDGIAESELLSRYVDNGIIEYLIN